MILAKVLSRLVSTAKHPSFEGKKIFVVQPLNEKLEPSGTTTLAFDSSTAGPGDIVLICREGNGCRQIWGQSDAPVNSVIAGIVDSI